MATAPAQHCFRLKCIVLPIRPSCQDKIPEGPVVLKNMSRETQSRLFNNTRGIKSLDNRLCVAGNQNREELSIPYLVLCDAFGRITAAKTTLFQPSITSMRPDAVRRGLGARKSEITTPERTEASTHLQRSLWVLPFEHIVSCDKRKTSWVSATSTIRLSVD